MDSEYLILAFVLTLIGLAGIALFNGPKTPAGDSCYCIIPSPEAGAMQGTSGILLIFGVMFIPIAFLKGGLPGQKVRAAASQKLGSGRVITAPAFNSGMKFAVGIVLIIVGVDFVLVPGYFILESLLVQLAGAVIVAIGTFLAYTGSKLRK